jgi:hypothetical protein
MKAIKLQDPPIVIADGDVRVRLLAASGPSALLSQREPVGGGTPRSLSRPTRGVALRA